MGGGTNFSIGFPIGCHIGLGMMTGDIRDYQITASSTYSTWTQPFAGRLWNDRYGDIFALHTFPPRSCGKTNRCYIKRFHLGGYKEYVDRNVSVVNVHLIEIGDLVSKETVFSGPKRTVTITDHFTCISTNRINCTTYNLCKKISIGETDRRLGDRFREHLRDVEMNDKDTFKPVTRHFNVPNHSQKNT